MWSSPNISVPSPLTSVYTAGGSVATSLVSFLFFWTGVFIVVLMFRMLSGLHFWLVLPYPEWRYEKLYLEWSRCLHVTGPISILRPKLACGWFVVSCWASHAPFHRTHSSERNRSHCAAVWRSTVTANKLDIYSASCPHVLAIQASSGQDDSTIVPTFFPQPDLDKPRTGTWAEQMLSPVVQNRFVLSLKFYLFHHLHQSCFTISLQHQLLVNQVVDVLNQSRHNHPSPPPV